MIDNKLKEGLALVYYILKKYCYLFYFNFIFSVLNVFESVLKDYDNCSALTG